MIKIVLRLFFRLLFRIRLQGPQHSPAGGKLLVIANHESFLDGLLLGLFLPFRATFVVHTTVLDSPWFRLPDRYPRRIVALKQLAEHAA